jgi:hypothetical protein
MARLLALLAALKVALASFDCTFFDKSDAYGTGAVEKVKSYLQEA